MQKTDEQECPICACTLAPHGRAYSLDELFSLWKPIVFSSETIDDHRKQSEYTRLYACPVCKLEVFFPQVIGTPNFYIELQDDTSGSYYVDDKWDFQEALRDVKCTDKVVEIGCGPGIFLEKVQRIVGQAIGIEYNQRALEMARNKGLTVYGSGSEDVDIESLKGQFDIAVSFHVLEHVSDPIAFVQEMLVWVKPGGKIGLSVPNMDGPVKYIVPCVSNMPPHHATGWELKTFQSLAEKLGLVIERFSYEPLIVRDHYYYSYYTVKHWLADVFPARLVHMAQKIAARCFELMFRVLAMVDKHSIRSLKGQSIYVLLSKREDGK